MAAFWPGPLTLLLPRSAVVPDSVTAGRPLVGVRMPSHPVAFELIRRAGLPIAAPSANTFSRTSPTTAAHVLEDLDGRIDAILDAGPTPHGVESTVLDPNSSPMVIYRPGAISPSQIREVAGAVESPRQGRRGIRPPAGAAVARSRAAATRRPPRAPGSRGGPGRRVVERTRRNRRSLFERAGRHHASRRSGIARYSRSDPFPLGPLVCKRWRATFTPACARAGWSGLYGGPVPGFPRRRHRCRQSSTAL